MSNALKIIQLILAIILITVVLLQQKGSGLGLVFGGDSNFYRSRRGIENLLHWTTIVTAVLFCGVAIAVIFIS